MTAKPEPVALRPAPAELAALAATHPALTEDDVRQLIAAATIRGISWPRILRAITWELADPATTMHDLRTAVYAGAPGKIPR